MQRKRSIRILATYLLSLLATLSMLVVWVVYVARSSSRIEELGARVGASAGNFHWILLTCGCALFFVLVAGLTYQLAQALAERRYSEKQQEFISNITHEMRSPLAAIKLHAQTLEQEDLDAADRRRSVDFILQQAERMDTLVDNVLESSRLLARKRRLDLERLSLAPFLERYFEEVRPRIEAHGVRLLPRVESGAAVQASPDALHRVLDNLLDNAVRFSERGGEVRVTVSDGAGTVRLEVADDGAGIPKKELTKIFDRFYQSARGGGGRRRGTGLGLAIVFGLVREMKGTVRAFSQEGRPGTRFVIDLPAAVSAAAAPARPGAGA